MGVRKNVMLADRLFDGDRAAADLEDALEEAGASFERLGWDHYDCSLELYGSPPDHRLSEQAQRVAHGAGFLKVFVNHTDGWETHYGFRPSEPFAISAGWRVSRGHKRGGGPTLVEADVPGWPREWFESGAVVIVEPSPDTSPAAPHGTPGSAV